MAGRAQKTCHHLNHLGLKEFEKKIVLCKKGDEITGVVTMRRGEIGHLRQTCSLRVRTYIHSHDFLVSCQEDFVAWYSRVRVPLSL